MKQGQVGLSARWLKKKRAILSECKGSSRPEPSPQRKMVVMLREE